ncbi:unnamed protein product [Choristocarpus tenellus]
MEVCVSFGGKRLSSLLRMLATDFASWCYGFPDLILWRPRRRTSPSNSGNSGQHPSLTCQNSTKNSSPSSTATSPLTDTVECNTLKVGHAAGLDGDFNSSESLNWEGWGFGWEVLVVEVKSARDVLSAGQKAWISSLREIGVECEVCRVAHRTPALQSFSTP